MDSRRFNAQAVPIGELVAKVMQRRGFSRVRAHQEVFDAWERVVPANIAQRTRPVSYRQGRLLVLVHSAPLFEELRCFRKDEFLDLLNCNLQSQSMLVTVRELRFQRG